MNKKLLNVVTGVGLYALIAALIATPSIIDVKRQRIYEAKAREFYSNPGIISQYDKEKGLAPLLDEFRPEGVPYEVCRSILTDITNEKADIKSE